MNHTEWAEKITGGDSVNAIANTAKIVHRTFARQMERGHISPENVIAIAVAYDHHPVGALVDTGYLDPKWAEQVDPMRALRAVTEQQLADEVLRRMELGVQHGGALDTPIDELSERRRHRDDLLVASDYPENVMFAVPPESLTPEQREYLRRSNKNTPGVADGGYGDGMPDDAVAYGHDEVGGTLDDFEP